MVAFFCKSGSPVDVFYALKSYLERGFASRHMQVIVTAHVMTAQFKEGDN